MVQVKVDSETAIFEVEGWDKVWALTSKLIIPLEHIESVEADPHPAMGWFQGLKIAGTDLPHVFRAGLFWQEGNRVFWDVRHPEKTIVLELEDESYAKLIVEVEDPQAAVAMIREALAGHQASKAAAEKEVDQFLPDRAY